MNKAKLKTLRDIYEGKKLHIDNMKGEPQYSGKEGTVSMIDDAGQIHGTWGGCALIPGEDDFYIIKAGS